MIVIGFFELVFNNYLATRPHFVGENINIEGSHGRFGFDEFELYPNCLAQNLKIFILGKPFCKIEDFMRPNITQIDCRDLPKFVLSRHITDLLNSLKSSCCIRGS